MFNPFRIFQREDRLFGAKRNKNWRKIGKEFLKGKVCAVCGGKKKIIPHHKVPVHINPAIELEVSNLIALCDQHKCHFIFGHLGSWFSHNSAIEKDAEWFYNKIKGRP